MQGDGYVREVYEQRLCELFFRFRFFQTTLLTVLKRFADRVDLPLCLSLRNSLAKGIGTCFDCSPRACTLVLNLSEGGGGGGRNCFFFPSDRTPGRCSDPALSLP